MDDRCAVSVEHAVVRFNMASERIDNYRNERFWKIYIAEINLRHFKTLSGEGTD